MRIIFLDVDGVLNTERFLQLQANSELLANGEPRRLDPLALRNLRDVVEFTNAFIVVTSKWRLNRERSPLWHRLMDNLSEIGLKERVIGVTGDLSDTPQENRRWLEIQSWLADHKRFQVKQFVILDDDDLGEAAKGHLVKCNPHDGLSQPLKKKAIQILLSGQRISAL